jgi:hypothetical protein
MTIMAVQHQIRDLFKPFACDTFQVLSSFDLYQLKHSKGCLLQQSGLYLSDRYQSTRLESGV